MKKISALLSLLLLASNAYSQEISRPYNCNGENGAEIAFFIKAGEPVGENSSFIAQYFFKGYSYLKCATDVTGGNNFNCRVRSGDNSLKLAVRETHGQVSFESSSTDVFGNAYRDTGSCEVGPT